jgi:hypothetical protein
MSEITIELTDEQIEAVRRFAQLARKIMEQIANALQKLLDNIRKLFEPVSRWVYQYLYVWLPERQREYWLMQSARQGLVRLE